MRWWKLIKNYISYSKNSEVDDPGENDVFTYGCKCSILQLLKLPDGTVKLLVEGIKRIKIIDFNDGGRFITCKVSYCEDVLDKKEDLYPLSITALRRFEKLSTINRKISTEIINNLKLLKDPSQIADNIVSHLNISIQEKQQLFEIFGSQEKN